MKTIVLLICFLSYSREIFSQDLEGKWIGHFKDYNSYYYNKKVFISISIYKLNDSTYNGQSITITGNKNLDPIICNIEVILKKGNTVMIEETNVIKSPKLSAQDSALAFLQPPICLQRMKLKYKNNALIGNWKGVDEGCGFGTIIFSKNN